MNNYPAQNIHLSSHKGSLRIMQMLSFAGAVVILLASIALLLEFFLHFGFFEKAFVTIPTIIALMLSGIEIFLYKKSKKFQLLGIPLLLIGIMTILDQVIGVSALSYLSTGTLQSGIVFFMVGLGFILSILPIPHRYHFMQLTIMVALSVVLFGFLERFYQFLIVGRITAVEDLSLVGYLILFILCQSTILSKPGRGFVGIFTSDSRSSQLARMSLIYYGLLPPLLGVFVIMVGKIGTLSLSLYTTLGLFVVLFMIISVIITWINVKLLYPSEIDHYLMRESLRINNISLELNADDLSSKVTELEKEKKNVTDKFNNQQTLADLIDKKG